MTLCPVAIVAGCRKCPAFAICPLKNMIGDARKNPPPPDKPSKSAKSTKK
jgi:hypothetical protein